MSALRGLAITTVGRQLLAKLAAVSQPLSLTRVLFGTGAMPDGSTSLDFVARTDLVAPFAEGTCTNPIYEDCTLSMILEFRSDLNGGLSQAVWIREYGVYASDPDGGEILLLYGNLGEFIDCFPPYQTGILTSRTYPISIVIGELSEVNLQFPATAFLTSQDAVDLVHATLQKAVGMKTISVSIPVSAWVNDNSGRYPFHADVVSDMVKDEHYPQMILAANSLPTAAACGLSPLVRASEGKLRFFAQQKPTAALSGVCQLWKEGIGGDIVVPMFDLPVATATTLGGIKASDSLTVQADGVAKVELSEDVFASDDDVNSMLQQLFP